MDDNYKDKTVIKVCFKQKISFCHIVTMPKRILDVSKVNLYVSEAFFTKEGYRKATWMNVDFSSHPK